MGFDLKWPVFGLGILASSIAIIVIVLISLVYTGYQSQLVFYQALKKNVIQQPLLSITFQNSPCVGTLSPLLDLQWPGVNRICKCLFNNAIGPCTYKQLRSGCSNTGNVSPIPYTKYKGVYLCGERLDTNYDLMAEVLPTSECPNNMKLCGNSSNNSKLCFDKNKPCPLNDIVFSVSAKPDLLARGYSEIPVTYDGSVSLQFNSTITTRQNWYIYYSNQEVEKQIISEFRLGYEKRTCFHPVEKVVPKDQYRFLLDRDYLVSNCSEIANQRFDSFSRYLDTYSMYNLWLENEIFSAIDGVTPGFEADSVLYDFDLFIRGYYHVNNECLSSGSTVLFEKRSDIFSLLSFDDELYNKRAFFIAVVAMMVITIASLFTLSLFLLCDKNPHLFHIIFTILGLVLMIVVLGLVSAMLAKHRHQFKALEDISDRFCGDSQTSPAISESSSTSKKTVQYFIAAIVLILIAIVCLGLSILAQFMFLSVK